MALQKEIWINSIVEGLFADNSFLSRSLDHSEFVENHIVHVPNAGAPSKVVKDRSEFPATIKTREDTELKYQLHEFTSDPVRIPHAETVELSYNKRESVIKTDRANLHDEVATYILGEWFPKVKASQVQVSNKMTKDLMSQLQKTFNKQRVPQEGRVILLNADCYQDLLDQLTDSQSNAVLACADAKRGVLGKLNGFEILDTREFGETNQLGLAWHPNFVSRALGEIEMFENERDAAYYSDILSFLLRAGGKGVRADGKGVIGLVKTLALA